ncbi:MAG: F0F1 ATP synthase subunit B [bacterium]
MISINIYEILMQMFNFGVLLFFVNKLLAKPVSRVLQERSDRIRTLLDSTEAKKKEAGLLLEQQEKVLHTARIEAKDIRRRAEEAASVDEARLIKRAKEDADRLITNAKKEIDLQVIRAKKDLLDEAGRSALALSSQLLKRHVNERDQRIIMSEGVEQFN